MRRFALAVLAGTAVLAVAFLRLPAMSAPAVTMAVVVLTALGTGFFAARRGALAGLAIVYLGNLVFVAVNLTLRGTGEDPSGVAGFLGRLLMVQVVLLQFAIPAAIAGWAGTRLRRRLVPARA